MENKNDLYINIRNYLSNYYIENMLQHRYLNNEIESYNITTEELKIVSDFDKYFTILIKENTKNIPGEPLNKYLTVISKQLESQPLLLLNLPLWTLDRNLLRKYIPNYDRIIARINQLQSEANYIYRKFETSPISITNNELNKLLTFFIYSIPYADSKMFKAQEILAKYILTNPKDTTNNYEVSTFLIKFFGYKKIREENLKNTTILISRLDPTTYGQSTGNYVIINKKLLQSVTMENNTLQHKFGIQNKTYHEMLGILHTTYHEIRHQVQRNHTKTKLLDDLSYYYASFKLINNNGQYDYNTNYKCYEIEKDANYKAWEDIEKLIKNYISNRNTTTLMKNVLNHKLKEELQQITGVRKSPDSKEYLSNDLLIKYLDEKFRINPYLLTGEYQQFLNFYNYNGTPKRAIELLTQPLVYQYKDFFFGQVSYRSRTSNYRLTLGDLNKKTLKEIQTIINNMKILTNINQEKLNKICDRAKKYNETGTDVVSNIRNYHGFASYISNLTNEIIRLYPELINVLSIKNAIASINDNIEMINKNSLVNQIINENSQIKRVGRR